MAITSGDGDAETALHHVAVHRPPMPMMMFRSAWAQKSITQPISTLVGLMSSRLRFFGQSLVVVVSLVLHAGGQGDHGQVVGVHHGVDVAGQPQRKLGKRNALGQPAAGRRTLDVHGRPARGLANAGHHLLAPLADAPEAAQAVVVDFPSPSGVGVMAVTSINLPSGRSLSRWSTLR
jgi:hypothetical protein